MADNENEWEWEWDLEHKVKELGEAQPPGETYCTLCIAEGLGETTAKGYQVVARTLRMLVVWFPGQYEMFKGKCQKHIPEGASYTFWMMRKTKGRT